MLRAQHPASKWTPERIAVLKRMWLEEGASCSQIADALGGGVTRNGVIGKIHRLHIHSRPGQASIAARRRGNRSEAAKDARAAGRIVRGATVAKIKVARQVKNRPDSVPVGEAIPADLTVNMQAMRSKAWDALPGTTPVRMEDHREGQCRWPIGSIDDGSFRYCAAPVGSETSRYCRRHDERAHN